MRYHTKTGTPYVRMIELFIINCTCTEYVCNIVPPDVLGSTYIHIMYHVDCEL